MKVLKFIQCILPYNILDKSKQERFLGKNEVENDTEKAIISLIKENPYISKAKMTELTGKPVPTISRTLKRSKTIVRIGSPKGGRWKINE